jgi:hypothetical protein
MPPYINPADALRGLLKGPLISQKKAFKRFINKSYLAAIKSLHLTVNLLL